MILEGFKVNIQITGDKVSDNDQKIFDNVKENVLTLGAFSYINSMELWLGGKFYHHALIGRFCSLSWHLTFLVARNHNYKAFTTHAQFNSSKTSSKNPRQIVIGHDVWVGHGAMILGGVKIGNGAVIGAGAVVAKDIPPYAIAVGNPARVIKYRFDEETIKKFLAVKWWNWDIKKIEENYTLAQDVEKFLETHYSPALEEFPDDEFTQKLNNFAGGAKDLPTHCGLRGEESSAVA